MKNSNGDILDAVIILLQSQGRDLKSVTLEEAKEITFQLIRKRQSTMQPLETTALAAERSFCMQECSV